MGNVDVVIPVYKPDKKLQMVISRLMGQTIVPSNIFLIHTRSSEDDWHTEQLAGGTDGVFCCPGGFHCTGRI